MQVVIAKEVAKKEVKDWLDAIEVSQDVQDDLKLNTGIVVDALMTGKVVISGNKITQILRKPIGAKGQITELEFNTDLIVDDVQTYKKGIDPEYDNRNTAASICASTGNLYGIIGKMTTKDFNLSSAIVVFFAV